MQKPGGGHNIMTLFHAVIMPSSSYISIYDDITETDMDEYIFILLNDIIVTHQCATSPPPNRGHYSDNTTPTPTMTRALPLLFLVTLSCVSSLVFLLKIQNEARKVQNEASSLQKEDVVHHQHSSEAARRLTEEESPPLPPILNHHECKENAIVYLAQKRHSSYGRNSYSLLQKSLQLLHQNYLAKHSDNTALFIFHEGDFDQPDLEFMDSTLLPFHSNIHLVNLTGTHFWGVPEWLQRDDTDTWQGIKKYSVGYRHMIRWFALKIWDFFYDLNQQQGCNYRYIMRLDEESYIHSPIEYDLFQNMKDHDYVYGFRQCSYEMSVVQGVFQQFMKKNNKIPIHRNFRRGPICGFYNNLFIASLDFMRSAHVQQFLQWVDQQGFMYRRRLNDLVLHTAVVYAFAPSEKIHRFLDFTYEHFTLTKDGCPFWGGIQAGYADPNGGKTVTEFSLQVTNRQQENKCKMFSPENDQGVRINEVIGEADLSPTYQHLPPHIQGNLQLLQVAAGNVDKINYGIQSGR
jgi:hypothetical protein